MLILRSDVARVESDLISGLVACPAGDGALRPWGHARARVLRGEDRNAAFRPRRGRCGSWLVTQADLRPQDQETNGVTGSLRPIFTLASRSRSGHRN